MDILTIVGFAISGFVLVLLTIFLVGFKIKTPETETILDSESVKHVQWKEDIPELIKKHYKSIYETDGMPVVKTAMIRGTAKYQISSLWMPVIYHTWIINGTGFLRELDFYWYQKIILKGVDFWINGIGALQVNGIIRMNETGKNVTESQYKNFLAESLLLGTFDFSQEQIRWEILNEKAIRLIIPTHDNKVENVYVLDIYFEGSTGRIRYISSERFRGQLETELIPWTLRVKKWDRKNGMWVPQYHAKWEDQKKPWCHYKISNVLINASPKSVGEAIGKISTGKYKTEVVTKKQYKRSRRK